MIKKVIILGIAAALLLGAFGFTGCNSTLFIEIDTDDMVDCTKFHYSVTRSWIGNPIELTHDDENAYFECIVNNGSFVLLSPLYVKSVTLKPGDGFYWQPENDSVDERVFVDLFLKIYDSIIGYAVIEIYATNIATEGYIFDYEAKLLKSAIFPKVDGEYQNITENQVKSIIEKIKNQSEI